jgi:hypothetical protein
MDAVRALDEARFFDWFDPVVQADPEPIVNELRERTTVVRTPLGASVLRRREVQALLADSRARRLRRRTRRGSPGEPSRRHGHQDEPFGDPRCADRCAK